jgi:hypothetical protein
MKCIALAGLVTSVFLLLFASKASAAEFVGFVKSLGGQATVLRDGEAKEAAVGMEIKAGDIVKTGVDGSVGLIFSDDTIITMGSRTEFVVEDYLFEPLEGRLAFVAKILRGTISYLSGQIEKLSPGAVQLKTPAATIGVRGTHVLLKVEP